ncbi:MAG TPA: NADH-quinone oxidoreductase subunit J [Candidatus Anammoximicrobium sp.]|nr:NADH-quinone oxidoreductase subunit J [Candidatus Anammoximicrobium sp.]
MFAQTDWFGGPALAVLPPLLGFLAVWWLMPRAEAWPRSAGALLGLAALASGGLTLFQPGTAMVQNLLFGFFALVAIGAAVLMITNRNPLYSALWFVVVTLCVCGLFLLRSAPFLAAASAIVYAGAIIVTFLFLIMLAQQAVGVAAYDQRARQPLAATLLGFLVLGGLLCALRPWVTETAANRSAATSETAAATSASRSQAILRAGVSPDPSAVRHSDATGGLTPAARQAPLRGSPLSQRGDQPVGTVRGLGRSLFGDYLYAVELAGTLLMVASIGAIAIALRTPQGKR